VRAASCMFWVTVHPLVPWACGYYDFGLYVVGGWSLFEYFMSYLKFFLLYWDITFMKMTFNTIYSRLLYYPSTSYDLPFMSQPKTHDFHSLLITRSWWRNSYFLFSYAHWKRDVLWYGDVRQVLRPFVTLLIMIVSVHLLSDG
jgi:hypothetical protein